MPRFICNHDLTSRERFVLASGQTLTFDYHGVLDTDEEGARVIRGHPLYGRLILEEAAESAPTDVGPQVLQTPRDVLLPLAAHEWRKRATLRGLEVVAIAMDCAVCRRRFIPRSLNGGRRLYCSGKCRDRAYRARRGAEPRWYLKLLRNPFGHDEKRAQSPVRGMVVKVGGRVKAIFR